MSAIKIKTSPEREEENRKEEKKEVQLEELTSLDMVKADILHAVDAQLVGNELGMCSIPDSKL